MSLLFNGILRVDSLPARTSRFDSELSWCAYCNTGRVRIWSSLDPAYGAKIKMLNPRGKEVQKTWQGKQYGAKWDKLHSYKDTRLQPNWAWGSFEENQGGANGGRLLAPQELFSMDDPGIYTMEVQIQAFRYVPSRDPEEWSRNLLRFSPIRIKVEKPSPPSLKKD